MDKETLNAYQAKLFDPEVIDFAQFIETIKRNFIKIIGVALIVTLFAAVYALSLPLQYKSKVSILVESEKANIASIEEIYGLDSSRKEYFATQSQILQSRQIATRVVDEMSLYDNQFFDSNKRQENSSSLLAFVSGTKLKSFFGSSQRDRLASLPVEELIKIKRNYATGRLMQSMRVVPVKNTQIIEVYVETPSRNLSAEIANTIASVYIESYLQAKLEMTEKATSWLNGSLQGLRDKLDTAEKKLATFYEQEQLVDIDGVVGLASEQVQQLSQQLLDAQIALQGTQAIYEQMSQSELNIDQLSTIPEVLNHQTIQSVKRDQSIAKSRVSELQEVYGPKHPKIISAKAELGSINQSLSQQITRLVSGIKNEFDTTKAKVVALESDLAAAKSNFRKLSSLDSQRKTLQRDVDVNQQLYDLFFTRLTETDQLGGFESANARVLDLARPAGGPSAPNSKLIIAAAFILSFGAAVAATILIEALNSGLKAISDVEKKLGQRMLGIIPFQSAKKKEEIPLRHFFNPAQHLFAESVRSLRTSLQLLNIDKPSKTLLICSSVPKEGKSTVSINLAFAFGQLHKVLLIDADLRKPCIAKRFQFPGFQPGLTNAILGTHSLEECLVKDEQSNVDVLSAGTLPPNPLELLASEEFSKLMNSLKPEYDYIIIDSPPALAVSDASIISKHCDSLIYIAKSESTSTKIISRGLSKFIQSGQRIDGVIVNQVNLQKIRNADEYTGFYDQYGYNSYRYDGRAKT